MGKLRFGALVLSVAVLLVTVAVSVPILVRPFYYLQIDALQLEETTGYTKETMIEAYDQMMDYCLFDTPFGTGSLAYSEEGAQHFADVAFLFRLNFVLLGVALVVFLLALLAPWVTQYSLPRPLGRGWRFWGSVLPMVFFVAVGIAALYDFNGLFVAFHQLFFPGKTNWLFNPKTDQIITILPETFFMSCGFLIIGVLVALAVALMISDFHQRSEVREPSTVG